MIENSTGLKIYHHFFPKVHRKRIYLFIANSIRFKIRSYYFLPRSKRKLDIRLKRLHEQKIRSEFSSSSFSSKIHSKGTRKFDKVHNSQPLFFPLVSKENSFTNSTKIQNSSSFSSSKRPSKRSTNIPNLNLNSPLCP